MTDEQRFFSKVAPRMDDSGCWEWFGATSRSGYGHIEFPDEYGNKRQVQAHRVAWILRFGQIPDGLVVCHRCDNTHCVKPEHLFLGTQGENLRDMSEKKRGWASRTTCKRGHAFDAANTYLSPQPNRRARRNCRICNRVAARRYKLRHAGKIA